MFVLFLTPAGYLPCIQYVVASKSMLGATVKLSSPPPKLKQVERNGEKQVVENCFGQRHCAQEGGWTFQKVQLTLQPR